MVLALNEPKEVGIHSNSNTTVPPRMHHKWKEILAKQPLANCRAPTPDESAIELKDNSIWFPKWVLC